MASTTNYNWSTPDDTALVKDGAAAIRTLGSSIDTTTKALNPSTTLGDIEYRSATANTNTRLAIGTTGQVLTVAGGVPTWATPSAGGGGKVLQVVQGTTSTEKSIASTSFTDTNLTVTITPSSASSRIMILASQSLYLTSGSAEYTWSGLRLMRNATSVIDYSGLYLQAMGTSIETLSNPKNATFFSYLPITYVDSPASTSALVYKTQVAMTSTASSRATLCQQAGSTSSIIAIEIGA